MVQEEVISNCARCSDLCSGDVVNASGKYFHQYCFTCFKCSKDLIDSGYFPIDEEIFCKNDYHGVTGTKCTGCDKYIEGEYIAVSEAILHPECFGCSRCGKLFPVGATVAFDGDGFLCETCDKNTINNRETNNNKIAPPIVDNFKNDKEIPLINNEKFEHEKPVKEKEETYKAPWKNVEAPLTENVHSKAEVHQVTNGNNDASYTVCAGCNNPIKSGQALLALDKQWHLWCFTCNKCGTLLAGEYMGRDGVPYCEEDYQSEFGVTCAGCGGYITGKVLQAGEKHYHPHCSRCAKCGKMFGEGEEMYLQGSEIWHPQCSEDFRRESFEALDQLDDDEKRLPPSYESTVEALNSRRDSHTSSNLSDSRNMSKESFENMNNSNHSNHQRKFSDDSLGADPTSHSHHSSIEGQHYSLHNSSDEHIVNRDPPPFNIRKLSQPIQPRPKSAIDLTSSQRAGNPPGFRSVKPPQFNVHTKSVDDSKDDDDAPPPIPPPPRRSTSNSWKDKYVSSGVYTAKPFQKYDHAEHERQRPLSFVESAARRASSMDSLDAPDNKPATNGRLHRGSTDSNPDDNTFELGTSSYSAKNIRVKGVGYNKLQLRKMQQQQQQHPVRTSSNASESSFRSDSLKRGDKLNYLTDDEFLEVFNMSRDHFYAMPKWKQEQLKKQKPL